MKRLYIVRVTGITGRQYETEIYADRRKLWEACQLLYRGFRRGYFVRYEVEDE